MMHKRGFRILFGVLALLILLASPSYSTLAIDEEPYPPAGPWPGDTPARADFACDNTTSALASIDWGTKAAGSDDCDGAPRTRCF